MTINIKVKPVGISSKPFEVNSLQMTNTVADLKKIILDTHEDIKPGFSLIVAGVVIKDDSLTLEESKFKPTTLVMLKPLQEATKKTASTPTIEKKPEEKRQNDITSPIVPQIPIEDKPMSQEETECFAYLVDAGFEGLAAKNAAIKAKGDVAEAVKILNLPSEGNAPLTNIFQSPDEEVLEDEGIQFDLDQDSKLMILQSLSQTNPDLFASLIANPSQMKMFFQMIAEEAVVDSQRLNSIEQQLSDEDKKVIESLMQITGKERDLCVEAYIVNDKNADLAISYLLDDTNYQSFE